jgi:hypothetical protein
VSNFCKACLECIAVGPDGITPAKVSPAVNQIQFHVGMPSALVAPASMKDFGRTNYCIAPFPSLRATLLLLACDAGGELVLNPPFEPAV